MLKGVTKTFDFITKNLFLQVDVKSTVSKIYIAPKYVFQLGAGYGISYSTERLGCIEIGRKAGFLYLYTTDYSEV